MEALWGFPDGLNGKFCVSAIDDENTFIHHVVLADLAQEETIELIAGILLVVSGRRPSDHWIAATVNELQLTALGMHLGSEDHPAPPVHHHPLGFVDEEDLARVFMQAPTPVCMLAGPEHTVTFINPAYLAIVGRPGEDVIGKPVREVLSESEGRPFFALLDNVYKTGEPYIGVDVPANFGNDQSGINRETYVDFVYHPVRDSHGVVCGILCQANDVTERVLEKQVRESREEQLYRQWAELDAIYRTSPVGMCLIAAKDYSILRVNELKAKMLGAPVEKLIGRKMTDIFPGHKFIPDAYQEVVTTKAALNFELTADLPGDPGKIKTWRWDLNPVLSASGNVESIASTVVEITDRPTVINALLSSEATAAR